MIKVYCDYCGERLDKETRINIDIWASNDVSMKTDEMDFCPECWKKVQDYIIGRKETYGW